MDLATLVSTLGYSLEGFGVLVIVLIRTVLVFTIHLELEGRWPWQSKKRGSPCLALRSGYRRSRR